MNQNRVAVFFNTKTGKMLNEKLLELLKEKKIEFNNNNNVLLEGLIGIRKIYEETIDEIGKMVA